MQNEQDHACQVPKSTGDAQRWFGSDQEVWRSNRIRSRSSERGKWTTLQHRYAVMVYDFLLFRIQSDPTEKQMLAIRRRACSRSCFPIADPSEICTDSSMEFMRACKDFSWKHDTSTPYRSETNWIAERAVRRVKEGTASVFSVIKREATPSQV